MNTPPEDAERHQAIEALVHQVQAMVEGVGQPDGFNTRAWVMNWIACPVPALGGVCPEELLGTPEGRASVSQILAQIASGTYA